MSLKPRGQIIHPTDTAQLKAIFQDSAGNLVDLDTFPTVSIREPSGLVSLAPTSAGVTRLSLGTYEFDYAVGLNPSLGIYNDIWRGNYLGSPVEVTFSFIVSSTDLPSLSQDGYAALGDDIGFNYSQLAIQNINKLIKALRARLKSSGKSKKTDANGNVIYQDCDIFSVDALVSFLVMSLSDFNQTPHFTAYTFESTEIINMFLDILVRGASLYALASQALIERGREHTIQDNGISFTPPTVSEILNTQYSTALSQYWEQLKMIKASMKPAALGLGVLGTAEINPRVYRMRMLRARRLF